MKKITIKMYKMKSSFLTQEEKEILTSKFIFKVFVDGQEGRTFQLIDSEYDSDFEILDGNHNLHGERSIEDAMDSYSTFMYPSGCLDHFFGKKDAESSLFSKADLLEIPSEVATIDMAAYTKNPVASKTFSIELDTHGLALFEKIDKNHADSLSKSNIDFKDAEDIEIFEFNRVEDLFESRVFEEPDFYPPSDLLPESKELKTFSDWFQDSENRSSEPTEIIEWLDQLLAPRLKKLGNVIIVTYRDGDGQHKQNFVDYKGNEVMLSQLFE